MAFPWLWPAAFASAQATLQPCFPAKVEDVAIESLEALVEKVREMKSVEELKPLVAGIAHHRAVSRLREWFAKPFLVEQDFAAARNQAKQFIQEQTGH